MKICFLADAGHVNTQNWVRYFSDCLGHDVYLLSFNKAGCDLGKVKIIYLHSLFYETKWRYLFSILKTKKIVKSLNPDILVAYRPSSYGFLASCIGFKPLVIALQGQHLVYPATSKLKRIFAIYALKKADIISSWGQHMTDDLIHAGIHPEKIRTYPRGVRIYSNNSSDQRSKKECRPLMISTRSLRPGYNFQQIMASLPIIVREIKEFSYIVAGDGEDRKRLETMAAGLGVQDYVKFIGKQEYDTLMQLLNSCDIYVSAVPTDGVSSSLLEAFACGIFPIVPDNVANRLWIKDGVNGFLFPLNDPKTLAEKIILAVKAEGLRKKARDMNLQIAKENADWDRNMARMEHDYLKLIKERKSLPKDAPVFR